MSNSDDKKKMHTAVIWSFLALAFVCAFASTQVPSWTLGLSDSFMPEIEPSRLLIEILFAPFFG